MRGIEKALARAVADEVCALDGVSAAPQSVESAVERALSGYVVLYRRGRPEEGKGRTPAAVESAAREQARRARGVGTSSDLSRRR